MEDDAKLQTLSSQSVCKHIIVVACIGACVPGCGKAFTTDKDSDASIIANTSGGTSSEAGVASAISKDGLLLWLRSDQGATDANGFVSQWLDQSGHHFDAIQNEAASRPTLLVAGIGGHPTLRFDGVDDSFQLPSGMADFALGLTMFVVVNERQSDLYASLLEFSNGSEVDDIAFGQYQNELAYEVADQSMQGDPIQYNVPQIYTAVHNTDGNLTLRRNGSVAGTYTLSLPVTVTREQNFVGQSLYAGSGTYFGLLGEVLVYGRALSDADLVNTESDLKRRWSCCN